MQIANVLVPGMAERGSGAFLVAQGIGVREVVPVLASVPQSALLHYLRALAQVVAPRGVRVASRQIGRLIRGSAAEALVDRGHLDDIAPRPTGWIPPTWRSGSGSWRNRRARPS